MMNRPTPAVAVADNPREKRFEARVDGELVGWMEYIPLPGKIIATHTEVVQAWEGQGIGGRLVSAVLQTLRDDQRAVQPLCPYVTAYLRRHPEWDDVVDASTPH